MPLHSCLSPESFEMPALRQGLLVTGRSSGLAFTSPSRRQAGSGGEEVAARKKPRDRIYSYGDSSGFAPDSLLTPDDASRGPVTGKSRGIMIRFNN